MKTYRETERERYIEICREKRDTETKRDTERHRDRHIEILREIERET